MPKQGASGEAKSQRQKFTGKARELETDESPEAFERTLKVIANAPPAAAEAKPPRKKR